VNIIGKPRGAASGAGWISVLIVREVDQTGSRMAGVGEGERPTSIWNVQATFPPTPYFQGTLISCPARPSRPLLGTNSALEFVIRT
jgi:hypothetical protein